MVKKIQDGAEKIQANILSLLDELPLESLDMVEQFVRFLYAQAEQEKAIEANYAVGEGTRYRFPTIPVPAIKLRGLIGIMPPVGGDALEDTESLK